MEAWALWTILFSVLVLCVAIFQVRPRLNRDSWLGFQLFAKKSLKCTASKLIHTIGRGTSMWSFDYIRLLKIKENEEKTHL
jgi:hypothetical protein